MRIKDSITIINQRIKILSFIFLFIGGVIISHLFSIQILNHNNYLALADKQHLIYEQVVPKRGAIYVQDIDNKQIVIALDRAGFLLYAAPKLLSGSDLDALSAKLSLILKIDKDYILKRISKPDDPFEPIKENISNEEKKAVDALGLNDKGLNYLENNYRFYPQNDFLSQVIGYAGFRDGIKAGNYGIEEFYDKILSGLPGYVKASKDAGNKLIPTAKEIKKPVDDVAIILTIDQNIQLAVENKLNAVVKKWDADGGSAIIIDPKTGKILAMAQSPAYNPNNYSKVKDLSVFKNKNIQEVYEPGSVIKPITAAIALELGKITPNTIYNDEGLIKISGYDIKNFDGKSHGIQTMTQVLEKSLNTGAVFMQRLIGKEDFLKYLRNFGLDELTNTDLAGEARGKMVNLYSNRDINYATAAFGQGISVTPIELIRAFGAIANNGVMMRPYVVDRIVFSDGSEKITSPKTERNVISKETAITLTRMLVNVVDNGFDKARINGYYVAGKTGTAQVPDLESSNYGDTFIHTFVGYAPAFNPRFVILLRMDNPKGIKFAADSLSPVFKNIAEYILNYYKVPMDIK